MYRKYVDELKKYLTYIKDTNNDNAIFRCPYCGDSAKSPHKGHLYISYTNGMFICFRCEYSGFITKITKDFCGLNQYYNLLKETYEIRKNNNIDSDLYIKSFSELINKDELLKNLNFFNTEENYVTHFINSRCNIFGDQNVYNKFKNMNYKQKLIVTAYYEYFLFTIIKDTGLQNDRYLNNYFLNNLSENLIYLSFFKNTIFLRKSYQRYYYKIKLKNNMEYPVIISNDKLFNKPTVNVFLAEGIFDILNLYLYNEKLFDIQSDILISSNGKKSLFSAVKFFEENFMIPYNLYIFLDLDMKDKITYLKRIINKNKLLFLKDTFFLYNSSSKDYGDIFSPIFIKYL